jgi:hypothetical protein
VAGVCRKFSFYNRAVREITPQAVVYHVVQKRTDYLSDHGLNQSWYGRVLTAKTQAEIHDSAFAAGGASAVMLIAFAFPIDDGKKQSCAVAGNCHLRSQFVAAGRIAALNKRAHS